MYVVSATQGSMFAEVEAMRKGVEDERKLLSERSAALAKEARENACAARAENGRLIEEARCSLFPYFPRSSVLSSPALPPLLLPPLPLLSPPLFFLFLILAGSVFNHRFP